VTSGDRDGSRPHHRFFLFPRITKEMYEPRKYTRKKRWKRTDAQKASRAE